MNYIINPSWFYWLNVADTLKFVMIATVICEILLMFPIAIWFDELTLEEKKRKRLIKAAIVVFLVCALGAIFVPSKQTLIEMQVAKFATYENAEWTVDTIKSAVDYIVEAVNSIK